VRVLPRRLAAGLLALLLTTLALFLGPASAAGAGGTEGLPSPSGWPLAGEVRVLRAFAPPAQRWQAGHRGVDLAAAVGDPVLAAAGGTVTFAGRLAGRGVVVVSHGALRTTYEPVQAAVAVGQRVIAGAALGTVQRGSHCTGRSCLHWGLREGDRYLDPMTLGRADDAILRLLPQTARAEAERRAAARVAAAERAARKSAAILATAEASGAVGTIGPAGSNGFRRPVAGAITSPYGQRLHPVLRVWKLHDGTDFGASCGTPIRAPYAGRVTRAYYNTAYGQRLILDHGVVDGQRVQTGYNHAARYVVAPGQRVTRGETLGYVGSTGYSTGCHLHLMVWLGGRLIDPMRWF
jgi:murein DD-endopeptidase MepM/ murein hydrolase activator NlpD